MLLFFQTLTPTQLHMETKHPEGGHSPFVADDDASIAAVMSLYDGGAKYASCPVQGCGETIAFMELDSHIEMHGAEREETDSEPEPSSKRAKLDNIPGGMLKWHCGQCKDP